MEVRHKILPHVWSYWLLGKGETTFSMSVALGHVDSVAWKNTHPEYVSSTDWFDGFIIKDTKLGEQERWVDLRALEEGEHD